MALSEHEQRLLEELERGLYASEADSVPTSGGRKKTPTYRAIVIGILLFLVGVGFLIAGAATGLIWLGIIGFVGMLGGVLYIFSPANQVEHGSAGKNAGASSTDETLTERFERRWGERMDGER